MSGGIVHSETRQNSLCSHIIAEMEGLFGDDRKRIDHALSVLSYATRIQQAAGGDKVIVQAAAVLHDIGIHAAERKHGSSAGIYQEIEGPPIARQILSKYEFSEDEIEHICRIVGSHHSARDIDTLEFQIVWDADWLVNIPVEFPGLEGLKLRKLIDRTFRTDHGLRIAEEVLIKK